MALFKALPTGTIVGTTDTQTLTNKTLTAPSLTGTVGVSNSGAISVTAASGGNVSAISTNSLNAGEAVGYGILDAGTTKWVLTKTTGNDFSLVDWASSANAIVAKTNSGAVSIKGTGTNDSASAGYVGEYVSNTASSVSLTNATTVNVTSISLTAGDWNLGGVLQITPAATTNITTTIGTFSNVSANRSGSLVLEPVVSYASAGIVSGGNQIGVVMPTSRVSLSATTTIYLLSTTNFTISTCTANGSLWARRVR